MSLFKTKEYIKVTRDSINMGDDVMSPHLIEKKYDPNQSLLAFCNSLPVNYLPSLGDDVWIIKAKNKILGFIYYNKLKIRKIELLEEDKQEKITNIKEIHLKYIGPNFFIKPKDGSSYVLADPNTYYDEYPECKTTIKKVKKHFLKNK